VTNISLSEGTGQGVCRQTF